MFSHLYNAVSKVVREKVAQFTNNRGDIATLRGTSNKTYTDKEINELTYNEKDVVRKNGEKLFYRMAQRMESYRGLKKEKFVKNEEERFKRSKARTKNLGEEWSCPVARDVKEGIIARHIISFFRKNKYSMLR